MKLTRRQFLFGAGRQPAEEPSRPATAAAVSSIPGIIAADSTFSLEAFYAARASSGEASERPPIAGPRPPIGARQKRSP